MAGAQQPPLQQISRVYSFAGLLTSIPTAGLSAKSEERRSKDTGTARAERVQKRCPVPSVNQAWLLYWEHQYSKSCPVR